MDTVEEMQEIINQYRKSIERQEKAIRRYMINPKANKSLIDAHKATIVRHQDAIIYWQDEISKESQS
jgi:hypothetical protein